MGLLTKLSRKAPESEPETLEDALLDMCQYGAPKLSMLKTGWHCWIEMRVTGSGVSFEVKSEFGHKTPRAAVNECRNRIKETIAQLGA